jgi:hypothetical protein
MIKKILKNLIGWVIFIILVLAGLYAYDYYRISKGQNPITILKIGSYKNYEKINIRGKVESVLISSDAKTSTIVVKGVIAEGTDTDYASIKVTLDTVITKAPYNEKLVLGQIVKGDIVEVTFSGPVLESYPVQATAKHITIVE